MNRNTVRSVTRTSHPIQDYFTDSQISNDQQQRHLYTLHNHGLHRTKLIWNDNCPTLKATSFGHLDLSAFQDFGIVVLRNNPSHHQSCSQYVCHLKGSMLHVVRLVSVSLLVMSSTTMLLHIPGLFLSHNAAALWFWCVPSWWFDLCSLSLMDVLWNARCHLCQVICED